MAVNKKNNRSRYEDAVEGEWIYPPRKYHYMQCCDCALVHKMEFGVQRDGRGVMPLYRVWRDDKRTKAIRKREKITVKRGK